MKNIIIILPLLIAFNCDKPSPLDLDIYKLDNGLTVVLNEDHNETSVFGAVVIDGGSKRDPSDATGIAHYLEHLLFKGTHITEKEVQYSQVKSFSIYPSCNEVLNIDGEMVGTTPIKVTVQPRVIEIFI